jgi:uncharacterized membrane protein
MILLVTGLVLFLGIHLVRVVAPGWREAMIARMGTLGWKGLYAGIALLGFVMLVAGYASARWTSPLLWGPPPGWLRMAVALVMIPALVLLFATYLPGRIRATLRHPMLIATSAWAAMHLLANGRVADVLLFGSFLAWSLVVMAASLRRPWSPPPTRSPALLWDGAAVAAGLAAWWWLGFGGGHILLFTMPVM